MLARICGGRDAIQIPGLSIPMVLQLISEVGTERMRWPSEKHFTSWLGLAGGRKQSGKRKGSSRRGAIGPAECFAWRRDHWPRVWTKRWAEVTAVCVDEPAGWRPTSRWHFYSNACFDMACNTSRRDSKVTKPSWWKPKRACCANSQKTRLHA